jgi:lycopene beta-cyclase
MDVIQRRMEARLNHLGITVRSIEEDEKCVIPMGGVLPVIPQRVLGIGGTAGMVHPSTGISFSRVHIKKSNNVHEPRNVFSSHPLTMA